MLYAVYNRLSKLYSNSKNNHKTPLKQNWCQKSMRVNHAGWGPMIIRINVWSQNFLKPPISVRTLTWPRYPNKPLVRHGTDQHQPNWAFCPSSPRPLGPHKCPTSASNKNGNYQGSLLQGWAEMLSTRNDAPSVVWQAILVKFQRIQRKELRDEKFGKFY